MLLESLCRRCMVNRFVFYYCAASSWPTKAWRLVRRYLMKVFNEQSILPVIYLWSHDLGRSGALLDRTYTTDFLFDRGVRLHREYSPSTVLSSLFFADTRSLLSKSNHCTTVDVLCTVTFQPSYRLIGTKFIGISTLRWYCTY